MLQKSENGPLKACCGSIWKARAPVAPLFLISLAHKQIVDLQTATNSNKGKWHPTTNLNGSIVWFLCLPCSRRSSKSVPDPLLRQRSHRVPHISVRDSCGFVCVRVNSNRATWCGVLAWFCHYGCGHGRAYWRDGHRGGDCCGIYNAFCWRGEPFRREASNGQDACTQFFTFDRFLACGGRLSFSYSERLCLFCHGFLGPCRVS